MDIKTVKATAVLPWNGSLSETTCIDEVKKASPLTIKERLALLNGVFPIDEAVVGVLPEGSRVSSVEHCGTSNYGITGRVAVKSPGGTESLYFIKVAFEDHGRAMLNGEYESSKVIYGLMNDFLPRPVGFGEYRLPDPPTYFYLSEFVDMDVLTAPDPEEFTKRLAQLHRDSKSPTAKFGFGAQTCDGLIANTVEWQASWATFFTKLLLGVCERDLATNGPWVQMERATEQLINAVIPRLLGCLETEGRAIKPCLIHGDLWEGNMGIHLKTGKSVVFDAGSYYAHNEMELGIWRCEFTDIFRAEKYTTHYLRHYPAAEPAAEFDDRNRLYSLKGALNYSAGHPGTLLRRTAYNDMCFLCEKYAPIEGIGSYDPRIDPSVTGARITPHVPEVLA